MSSYHLTPVSGNAKVGPIPVTTTSDATCPPTCPLQGNGCYAAIGPLRMHWSAVTSNGDRALDLYSFVNAIRSLRGRHPIDTPARHNQAGDLPGLGTRINRHHAVMIAQAFKHARLRAFTYTHKPVDARLHPGLVHRHTTRRNRESIRQTTVAGLAVNLSANNDSEADTLLALNLAPVVAVLPTDAPKVSQTPKGTAIVRCPATNPGDTTCATCGNGIPLCARMDRPYVIGFPAHGSSRKRAMAATGWNV